MNNYNKQYYSKNKVQILEKNKEYKKENNTILQRTKKICNHIHKFPAAWIFYNSLPVKDKEGFREEFEEKYQKTLQQYKSSYKQRKLDYDKNYVKKNEIKIRKYRQQYYKNNLDRNKEKLKRDLHKKERALYDKSRKEINSKNRRSLYIIKQCPALYFAYTQFGRKEKQNVRDYIELYKPDTHRKFLIYGIYNINNPNEIIYIGQHTYYKEEDGYMGSGVEIERLYKETGKENFSRIIFEKNLPEELAGIKERFYIQKYREIGQAKLNIANGGHPSLRAKLKFGQTIEEYRKESRRLSRSRRSDKIKKYEIDNKDKINKARKYRNLLKKCKLLEKYYNSLPVKDKEEYRNCFSELLDQYLIKNNLDIRKFCYYINKIQLNKTQ